MHDVLIVGSGVIGMSIARHPVIRNSTLQLSTVIYLVNMLHIKLEAC